MVNIPHVSQQLTLQILRTLNYLVRYRYINLILTTEECERDEAKYFKRFNSLRNTVSAVAKLRSDIAQGAQYALDLEETFQALEIQVEGIGAPITKDNAVYGYDKLKRAIAKYGNTYVKNAIDLYKKHNANSKSKWSHPLNGGMIFGLTATYHFLDTQVR